MSEEAPSLSLTQPKKGSLFDSVSPNLEMLETLVSMGFPRKMAGAGLSAVKNRSIDLAIGWIDEHRSDAELAESAGPSPSIASPSAPAPAAATPSFSAPVGTSSNLSSAGPAIRSRYEKSEEEKRKHEEKERVVELEMLRRDKAAEEARKTQLLKHIEEDKRSRAAKASGVSAAAVTAAPIATASASAAPVAKQALIQIRLPQGDVLKHQFDASKTLKDVHAFIAAHLHGKSNFNLVVPGMPKKEYNMVEHGNIPLSQTDLAPRGTLNVLMTADKGRVVGSEESTATGPNPPAASGDLSYEAMLEKEENVKLGGGQ